jgi:hypothetical protein
MNEAYLRNKDEYVNLFKNQKSEIKCKYHFNLYFGLFIENKMVCYINLLRDGNIIGYSSILGHHDFLKFNIMTKLHCLIIKWIYENVYNENEQLYLIYAGYSLNTSLQNWKNRHGFNKFDLIISNEQRKYSKLSKYKNQNVDIEIINNSDIKIISQQDYSTPGFKNTIKTDNLSKLKLNIENSNNLNLIFYDFFNKTYFKITLNEFEIDIDPNINDFTYGILIRSPKILDYFIVKNVFCQSA